LAKGRAAYRLRGGRVLTEIVRQGQYAAREFGSVWGEIQFAPRDRGLGVRPFHGNDDDAEMFTVPFDRALLLYRVSDGVRCVDLVQAIWMM